MPAAQYLAPSTAVADLALEAALAARVIRTARLPTGLVQWLARPSAVQPSESAETQRLCDPQLTAVLNEIIGPLSLRPAKSRQPRAKFAAEWLAVACRCSAEHSNRLQLGIGPRLLAASLLPLYRCLATGDLAEGLRQTQLRLNESLCLLAVGTEVGPPVSELLSDLSTAGDSPHAVLVQHFNLSLPHMAQLLGETTVGFDAVAKLFSRAASQRLQGFDGDRPHLNTPTWAAPDLLWKLAGELTSQRTELKLPRSWIDLPLPWNQIADHWHRLLEVLNFDATAAVADDADSTLAMVHEMAALIPGSCSTPASERSTSSNSTQSAADTAANSSSANANCDCAESARDAESHDSVHQSSSAERRKALPKVRISEILTHSDPSFVNVIRRQIGKCRSMDRALSLISLVVLPQDANHHFAVYDNGLNLWQQRLVSWLADHPQVVEPQAFLTVDGELLVCLMDLERNETTALLRHGLIETLTGLHFDDSHSNLLAEVDAPARYHAGIASIGSPGARFSPEQLIEPAIRCLSAARRHGKASIKSIEVY